MTSRHMSGAVVVGLLAWGLVAMAPAMALAQDPIGTMLPEQGGPITLVGCFLRLPVSHEGKKFVLVEPTLGPATSVTEETCTATGSEPMVELDDVHSNVHEHHLDRGKVGRWIEVTGRLEDVNNQTLREVHVKTYRIVPVVIPTAIARVEPAPQIRLQVQPPVPKVEITTAVGTTGTMPELPKTASSLPLFGLLGFLALAGAFALRWIGLRPTL